MLQRGEMQTGELAPLINVIRAKRAEATRQREREQELGTAAQMERTRISEANADRELKALGIASNERIAEIRESRLNATQIRSEDLANNRFERLKDKDIYDKEQDILGIEEDIMQNLDAPEVDPLMRKMNATENKPYYYHQYIDKGVIPGVFESKKGVRIALPVGQRSGKQITMADIRDSAAAEGISVEQYLVNRGILNADLTPK